MKFLDLYCGAGFGGRGAVVAGAMPLLAVDAWQTAADTYKANFPECEVLACRVDDIDPAEYGTEFAIDMLLASPECTSHSIARGGRAQDEESLKTALRVLPWVDEFEPDWVVLENVERMRRWEGHVRLKQGLVSRGYEIEEMVLDAKDFGVPQARKRLFMVCGRNTPPPSRMDVLPRKAAVKTARDVVDLDSKWPSRPLHREGRAEATIARANRAISKLGRGHPFLIVYYGSDYAGGWQSLDAPLRTVTTLDRFGLVTWDGNTPMLRMLQPPELLHAMGAESHELPVGSRRDRVKLCGNGICSPVVTAIVREISGIHGENVMNSEAVAALA